MRRSVLAVLLAAHVAALSAPQVLAVSASNSGATVPAGQTADLAGALGPRGEFVGAEGLAGSVDTDRWTLVSDVAAGEAPRFAPQAVAAASWSGFGSNGAGNGLFTTGIVAVAVSGSYVYIASTATDLAGVATADYVARWNGGTWQGLGSNGAGNGALTGFVQALAVSGSDVYVAGGFVNAAGIATADRVARWSETTNSWSALGSNGAGDGAVQGPVNVMTLAVSGSNVYVGGNILDVANIATADYVARWNGNTNTWSGLGSNGAGNGALNAPVLALAVSGSNVYVGGSFTDARGIATADYVARWSGSAWSGLGSNGAGNGAWGGWVHAIVVVGADLYVGGSSNNIAGIATADNLARWNGTGWFALGSNGAGNGAISNSVFTIAAIGTDIYAGGLFADAGGIGSADYVAGWNGNGWFSVGPVGEIGAINTTVYDLAVFSTQLYLCGEFSNAGGNATADRVATYGPITSYQPDGRIKKGSGSLVGNNIYNNNGASQSRTGSAARGSTITFTLSIQNDGRTTDRFNVAATGSAVTGYSVKYFRGTTEITAAVQAGTYQTANLAPGATFAITARVKVLSTAASGSSVTRLVTLTSAAQAWKVDAVKFVGKRA